MLTRRSFLHTASVSFGALLAPPLGLGSRPAWAGPAGDPVLVVVFLRGGADALNLVVPAGDARYYDARPSIRVASGSELPADSFFGFHPSFAPLMPRWSSGELAAIHACGLTVPTRSHFDAQDFIEFGAPGDKTVRSGWLNRYLQAAGIDSPIAAMTRATRISKSLVGGANSLALPALEDFRITGSQAAARRAALEQIHADAGGPLAGMVGDTMAVLDTLNAVDPTPAVSYPGGSFASALRDLAALIKADIGLRVATVDLGGWDHHNNENSALPGLVGGLAAGLAAFADDLGADLGRTLVLVGSEFGRRVDENGGGGCDHGAGGVMLGLGAGVQGGQVRLRDDTWPGLAPADLQDGIDLAVTTDFRDVFSEILDRHMGLADLSTVFPDFTVDPGRYLGLLG